MAEAYETTVKEIKMRLEAGDQLRSDGFFDDKDEDGGPAGELLEGVLLSAADAWERRKVPYIGRLFSRASFNTNVGVGESNYLLRLGNRLTYRQLVLMRFWVAAQGGRYEESLMSLGIDQDAQGGSPTPALASELDDLMSAGLVGVQRSDGTIGPPDPTIEGIADVGSLKGTDLAKVCLTPLGSSLHDLLGLDHVPSEDLDEVLRALRGEST